jgi:hypothetical protein
MSNEVRPFKHDRHGGMGGEGYSAKLGKYVLDARQDPIERRVSRVSSVVKPNNLIYLGPNSYLRVRHHVALLGCGALASIPTCSLRPPKTHHPYHQTVTCGQRT